MSRFSENWCIDELKGWDGGGASSYTPTCSKITKLHTNPVKTHFVLCALVFVPCSDKNICSWNVDVPFLFIKKKQKTFFLIADFHPLPNPQGEKQTINKQKKPTMDFQSKTAEILSPHSTNIWNPTESKKPGILHNLDFISKYLLLFPAVPKWNSYYNWNKYCFFKCVCIQWSKKKFSNKLNIFYQWVYVKLWFCSIYIFCSFLNDITITTLLIKQIMPHVARTAMHSFKWLSLLSSSSHSFQRETLEILAGFLF